MRSFIRLLFGQVVVALVLGVLLGWPYPGFAVALKPLGDGFIRLIKMAIAPLVLALSSMASSAPATCARSAASV